MMQKTRLTLLALSALSFAGTASSFNNSTSASMGVTIEVSSQAATACTINVPNNLSFVYFVSNEANGGIDISCNGNSATPFELQVDQGTYDNGGLRRASNSSGAFINYTLKLDGTEQSLFSGSTIYSGPTGSGIVVPVNITAPTGQNPPSGTYTDTLQVTLSY